MSEKRYKIYFLYLLLIPVLVGAQNTPANDFILSGQGHFGFIISHRNNMAKLIKGHIYGGELNYIFRTDGCKPWQQTHNYPEIGVCALYLYLANPQQLGNLVGLYPYTNIRFNDIHKNVGFNLRLGWGIGYLTKAFDRIDNHQNIAIGSNLNGFVNIRFNMDVKLSDSWRMAAGLGLSHVSNGAFKTPNLGLNMTTINLGIGYAFGNKSCIYQKDTIPPPVKKWETFVIAVAGQKELEAPAGNKYMVYGVQTNVYRTLNYKNKIGGGIEMAYNNATKQLWALDSVYTNKFSDIAQLGVKACYSFDIHRLSFPVELGVYVYKKQKHNGDFFNRIGVRYTATKHIIVNVTLFTHWAKADYFEWGLGYKF